MAGKKKRPGKGVEAIARKEASQSPEHIETLSPE